MADALSAQLGAEGSYVEAQDSGRQASVGGVAAGGQGLESKGARLTIS